MAPINQQKWAEMGYAIVPGILNPKQVERLRDLCEALYENNLSDNQGEIIPSVCLQNPELINVIFDDTVVASLASVVGMGYNIFPNFHVKINSFVDWHTDKAFMDATRSEQPFSFIQCAVYLQPNNPETGGGLDVLPGTHRDTSKSDYVSELSKSLLLIDANKLPPPVWLPTQAGDLVFWDGRLGHRATQALAKSAGRKFGIHWTVCEADADTKTYMNGISKRTGVFIDGKLVPTKRFADIAAIRYPNDFPDTMRRIIEKHGLSIATN